MVMDKKINILVSFKIDILTARSSYLLMMRKQNLENFELTTLLKNTRAYNLSSKNTFKCVEELSSGYLCGLLKTIKNSNGFFVRPITLA